MTVYNKIIFSTTLVACLAALAGFMGWKNMQSIKGVYSNKVVQYHEAAQSLDDLKIAAYQTQVLALKGKVMPVDAAALSTSVEAFKAKIEHYQSMGSFKEQANSTQLLAYADQFLAIGASLLQEQDASVKIEEMDRLVMALETSASALWDREFADCQKVGGQVVTSLKSLLYWMIGISGITFILSLVFGQLIARGLVKDLNQLRDTAKRLIAGDYSAQHLTSSKNEFGKLGDSFNKLAENLEQSKIIERQNLQLDSLNRQLKLKNDSLDSFVYRVSHDLKAPVVNLKSLLQLIRTQLGTTNGEKLEKSLYFMDQSASRLEQTIHDLLEVSRIERLLKENKELVNVKELLNETIQENVTIINSSAAKISCNFDLAPEIYFTRPNLKSILANLLTNSIKYRAVDRIPEIHLQSHQVDDFICLSIVDNGIGIDLEKHRDKLFGMFNRFHNHVEGSGVGLYIVKKLTDESGGKLEIESEPGIGTTLKIYFPIPNFADSSLSNASVMTTH